LVFLSDSYDIGISHSIINPVITNEGVSEMKRTHRHLFMMLACSTAFIFSCATAGEHPVFIFHSGNNQGGWLGISIEDITSTIAKSKNLKDENGAYVNSVNENSPADSAGIKEGDIIKKFNGREIYDAEDLVHAVRRTKPGSKVAVEIIRNEGVKTVELTIGKFPHRLVRNQFIVPPIPSHIDMFQMKEIFGLRLHELDEQLGKYFGAPNGKGLLVEHVVKGSTGEKAGFKAGDVIIKVGNESVEDIEDFNDAIEDVKSGDTIAVEIIRKGERQTLMIVANNDDESSFNFQFEDGAEAAAPDFDIEAPQINAQEMRHYLQDIQEKMKAFQEKEIEIPKEIEKELHERLEHLEIPNWNLHSI
jgi:membrane-associated protease RseP (regulator of RpoE activity)